MRTIDDFPIQQVVEALGRFKPTDREENMVRALATAPNRSMSRLELARWIGKERPESCNAVLGLFGRRLALELDPRLYEEWKPATGSGGDWVIFMNWKLDRWTARMPDDRDDWVFVMREVLARALDVSKFAKFQELDDEIAEVVEELGAHGFDGLSDTEREAIVTARRGQGVFRERLLTAWDRRCSATGSTFEPALVASHIKPWAVSTNEERLDEANGLLLVATLDRLFNDGFITFEASGQIRISDEVPREEYANLGLSPEMRLCDVPERSLQFLSHHRTITFRKRGGTTP